MNWPCRRNSKDPLVRAFLDEFKINLLSAPRKDVNVFDLYYGKGRNLLPPSKLESVLEPGNALPTISENELFALPERTYSDAYEAELGGRLLSKFFKVAGGTDIDAASSLKAAGARETTIKLQRVTRDSVGTADLHIALADRALLKEAVELFDKKRIYIVTGVIRACGLALRSMDENRKDVSANVAIESLLSEAKLDGQLDLTKGSGGNLVISGDTPFAIGVELVEASMDPNTRVLTLDGLAPALDLRDRSAEASRTLLGDPEGPIFVDLPQSSNF